MSAVKNPVPLQDPEQFELLEDNELKAGCSQEELLCTLKNSNKYQIMQTFLYKVDETLYIKDLHLI